MSYFNLNQILTSVIMGLMTAMRMLNALIHLVASLVLVKLHILVMEKNVKVKLLIAWF